MSFSRLVILKKYCLIQHVYHPQCIFSFFSFFSFSFSFCTGGHCHLTRWRVLDGLFVLCQSASFYLWRRQDADGEYRSKGPRPSKLPCYSNKTPILLNCYISSDPYHSLLWNHGWTNLWKARTEIWPPFPLFRSWAVAPRHNNSRSSIIVSRIIQEPSSLLARLSWCHFDWKWRFEKVEKLKGELLKRWRCHDVWFDSPQFHKLI